MIPASPRCLPCGEGVLRRLVPLPGDGGRFVLVEELIAGPSGQIEWLYPSINPGTKIVNVMTKDGVCYVNLDENFLTVINNVSTDISIYSIVNSLVELSSVNKVQILVNGEAPAGYPTNTFERNLDIVVTVENK